MTENVLDMPERAPACTMPVHWQDSCQNYSSTECYDCAGLRGPHFLHVSWCVARSSCSSGPKRFASARAFSSASLCSCISGHDRYRQLVSEHLSRHTLRSYAHCDGGSGDALPHSTQFCFNMLQCQGSDSIQAAAALSCILDGCCMGSAQCMQLGCLEACQIKPDCAMVLSSSRLRDRVGTCRRHRGTCAPVALPAASAALHAPPQAPAPELSRLACASGLGQRCRCTHALSPQPPVAPT